MNCMKESLSSDVTRNATSTEMHILLGYFCTSRKLPDLLDDLMLCVRCTEVCDVVFKSSLPHFDLHLLSSDFSDLPLYDFGWFFLQYRTS